MIRKMKKSDLNEILEIERLCFDDAWSRKDYEYELYDNPYAQLWVMIEDDRIVGYYDLWITFEQAEIANIAVLPDYQHRGLGQQLMRHLEMKAMENDCETIGLEVRVSNVQAIRLYENQGFSVINTKPGYYRHAGKYEDAYRMMKGI